MLFLKDHRTETTSPTTRRPVHRLVNRDTHAGPSNLRYGLDNWIYGMVGYSGFEGTVGGERHSFRQGFSAFSRRHEARIPAEHQQQFVGSASAKRECMFGSTANGNPSEYMPIANRYYEAVHGWSSSVLPGIAEAISSSRFTDKVRQVDFHGGFTAAAGHALYTARRLSSFAPAIGLRQCFDIPLVNHLLNLAVEFFGPWVCGVRHLPIDLVEIVNQITAG